MVRRGIGLELGTHGSTFGGNPLACAVARATLDVLLESDLIDRVDAIGDLICKPTRERESRVVREIRQVGLMIGIQLRQPVRPYVRALQERGVLALSAGTSVLRLLPPLVLTAAEAKEAGEPWRTSSPSATPEERAWPADDPQSAGTALLSSLDQPTLHSGWSRDFPRVIPLASFATLEVSWRQTSRIGTQRAA